MSTQTGTLSNDHLIGDDDPDALFGLGGDDRLEGRGGADIIDGGEGDDTMEGGAGDDTYYVDSLGDVVIELDDEGDDRVFSSVDLDLALGGYENVEYFTLTGSASRMIGITNGSGNALANVIEAAALGSATIFGMHGDDEIRGSRNSDELHGGNDNDTLYGLSGFDVLFGGNGDDTLSGGGNADELFGDDGSDNLYGGNGADLLNGGLGNDFLKGQKGNDTLFGDTGDDDLRGNDGNDRLIGAAGRDTMTGGSGADTFLFYQGDAAGFDLDTADRITDFSRGDGDKLDISGLVSELYQYGGQSFTFIGDEEFTGQTPDENGMFQMGQGVGEVRYEFIDGHTMVQVDFDGDAQADFAFRVDGTLNLIETDFQFWFG